MECQFGGNGILSFLAYDDHDIRGGGSGNSTPVMKRQGSKLSYGSNDSGESSGSLGVNNKVNVTCVRCLRWSCDLNLF